MDEQKLLEQFEADMKELHKCATFQQSARRLAINCKLGLWGVDGPNNMTTINEAMHYFEQYKNDGEYVVLLNT